MPRPKGRPLPESHRTAISAAMEVKWQDPAWREAMIARRAEARKRRHTEAGDSDTRAPVVRRIRINETLTPTHRERIGRAQSATWADPEVRAKRLAGMAEARRRRQDAAS